MKSPYFFNTLLSQKDEISCLEAFDEEMERLDHEFSLSVRQKKDDQYRKERKNRDAFLVCILIVLFTFTIGIRNKC